MNRTTKVAVALIVAASLSTMIYALPEQRAMAHIRLHHLSPNISPDAFPFGPNSPDLPIGAGAVATPNIADQAVTTPAKASSPVTLTHLFHGLSASALWGCGSAGFPCNSLTLFQENSGAFFMFLNTIDGFAGSVSLTGKFFQSPPPELSGGTLSPVTVHVTCVYNGPPFNICGGLPDKDITVQATWTATSKPFVFPSINGFTKPFHLAAPGGFVLVDTIGPIRAALQNATGTFNGQSLGQSVAGNTFMNTFTEVIVCIRAQPVGVCA